MVGNINETLNLNSVFLYFRQVMVFILELMTATKFSHT